jgi:hypothetical protein
MVYLTFPKNTYALLLKKRWCSEKGKKKTFGRSEGSGENHYSNPLLLLLKNTE